MAFITEPLNNPALPIAELSTDVAEILKNDEVSEVIHRWLGNDRKVGVLLMTNCWMMNLHTMYSLRERVQCLVAPQGDIDCPGYNYRDILARINKTDESFVETRELAKICVETAENHFARAKATILNKNEPDIIDFFKIFSMDLEVKTADGSASLLEKQIEALSILVKAFVEELKTPIARKRELKFFLRYIRASSFDFSNNETMMVDVVNWIISISYANDNFKPGNTKLFPKLNPKITEFRDLAIGTKGPSIVLKCTKGRKIYGDKNDLNPFAVIDLPPRGFSLFFPMFDCSNDKKLKEIYYPVFLSQNSFNQTFLFTVKTTFFN